MHGAGSDSGPPAQGITEPLIEEALKVFGAIEHVVIDKRKGFAYVDIKDTEVLRIDIAASPVKVTKGAVQVVERKETVFLPGPGSDGAPNPKFSENRLNFQAYRGNSEISDTAPLVSSRMLPP